eukprot:GEMP01040482.1.p1 GENE.GEMP01040482.1~~GEMP01040482.1.p1  ORF type:complete len:220 (+),score=42.53 GEMP01040482.1:131-790(+)
MVFGYDIPPARVALSLLLIVALIFIFVRTYFVIARNQLLLSVRRTPPPGRVPVECGWCQCMQYAPTLGSIFVCCHCHSSNRIPDIGTFRMPEGQLRQYEFLLLAPTFYKVRSSTPISDAVMRPSIYGDPNATSPRQIALAACSICMDSAGDMVLLPCAHGGLCENCAIRIAQDWNGEPKCPQCREKIETLVKLEDVSDDQRLASGFELRIPIVTGQRNG